MELTKTIVAAKGRASYLGERSLNHPDAGAVAISLIFNELIKPVKNDLVKSTQ